ncbi:uncharacterized protein ACIBXB_006714 [Morphnus guianensis]
MEADPVPRPARGGCGQRPAEPGAGARSSRAGTGHRARPARRSRGRPAPLGKGRAAAREPAAERAPALPAAGGGTPGRPGAPGEGLPPPPRRFLHRRGLSPFGTEGLPSTPAPYPGSALKGRALPAATAARLGRRGLPPHPVPGAAGSRDPQPLVHSNFTQKNQAAPAHPRPPAQGPAGTSPNAEVVQTPCLREDSRENIADGASGVVAFALLLHVRFNSSVGSSTEDPVASSRKCFKKILLSSHHQYAIKIYVLVSDRHSTIFMQKRGLQDSISLL